MKKVILISIALLFAGMTSVFAQEMTEKKGEKSNGKMSEVTLACKMDCGNCSAAVQKQLAFTKGVKFIEADFEKDIVVVKYRNDKTNTDKIIASLAEINYAASIYKPGCGNQKKGCCATKTASTEEVKSGGCSGKSTHSTSGCGTKTETGQAKSGCCPSKTTEPANK
jgi:copper chaperone CopZ